MFFNYYSPTEITESVLQLLKKFEGRQYKLITIPIKTESFSVPSDCYNNVNKKILLAKGKIRYGWSVYDNDYFIEAEKHAIWESPDGEYIDVSCSNSENINQLLFIMDDVDDGIYVPNIRCNYRKQKAIDDYFMIFDILNVLIMHYGRDSKEIKDLVIFPHELNEGVKTLYSLITDYREYIISGIPNCICGSTILYENCHGSKTVQRTINYIDEIIKKNNLKMN